MSFWERVKELIVSQNTTQEWVALKIGKRPDTFSRWVSRDTMPTAYEAYQISNALGSTVEYLISGKRSTEWKPPPHLAELVDAASKLNDNDLRKMTRMIKACVEDELEERAQSKIG